MKAAIAEWLWKVLARPMLEHIDRWANHHADTLERSIMNKVSRTEQELRLEIAEKVRAASTLELVELHKLDRKLSLIESAMTRHTDFRQFEAISFAAEKMYLDRDFWKQSTEDQRIDSIINWAKIYAGKNNWALPDGDQLRTLVCVKMEQIKDRAVGPYQ